MPREVVENIVLVGPFSELAHLQCFTCEFKWFCNRDRSSLCYGTITTIKQQPREAVWDPKYPESMWHNVSAVSSVCATYCSNLPICEHSHHSYIWYRQCSVSKCIGIRHVVVAPGALVTGHMANPHPFLPHHSRPGVGPTSEIVSFPDRIFRPPEKWVWWTAYSIFIQVRRNVAALFFSNLMLDVIKDCIPHCVRMIYYRNGCWSGNPSCRV